MDLTINWTYVVSAVVGVGAFLLAWAMRHMLDRLFLPIFLDWWAGRSIRSAVKRAETNRDNLLRMAQNFSDTRRLILHLHDRIGTIGVGLAINLLSGLGLTMIDQQEHKARLILMAGNSFGFAVIVTASIGMKVYSPTTLDNFERYWAGGCRRIGRLLIAAKWNDERIYAFIRAMEEARQSMKMACVAPRSDAG